MESKDKPSHILIAMTSHEKQSKIHSSIAQECVNEIKIECMEHAEAIQSSFVSMSHEQVSC